MLILGENSTVKYVLHFSKNIIEAHGGYLTHQADEEKTHFVICLI
ncbi:hypothetical protein SGQ44_03650 [Flavobacterium sp. Fl-77]|uniref:Uncharacterized protein n=1 Tax=Flavobacterium flavipigmentatum TaxID=2893884 RepID=A0AAJ2S9A2_9FLAO|nr:MULTISPECIES: hypothetical protein [unclassified Flavobacterium]MDX6181233.1 hypothetical protein [Flavobacterium sp. Fl-33]MDX6184834.1 hypothetical protein [Flavobacterium sp. Fl-77]